MSKIKQINPAKIVLPSVLIFFTAILILSLPVLLNYNSTQNIIEKLDFKPTASACFLSNFALIE